MKPIYPLQVPRRMNLAFYRSALSLARFVEPRKQFAEVHASDEVRFHNNNTFGHRICARLQACAC